MQMFKYLWGNLQYNAISMFNCMFNSLKDEYKTHVKVTKI